MINDVAKIKLGNGIRRISGPGPPEPEMSGKSSRRNDIRAETQVIRKSPRRATTTSRSREEYFRKETLACERC